MHLPTLFKHKTYRLRSLVILLKLSMRENKNHFKYLGFLRDGK